MLGHYEDNQELCSDLLYVLGDEVSSKEELKVRLDPLLN